MGAKVETDIARANVALNAKTQKHLRKVSAQIIEVDVKKAGAGTTGDPEPTQTLPEEPWGMLFSSGSLIEPPFDLMTLAMLSEHSSELGQCIEAMEVNIEGYGCRFISRLRADDTDEGDSDEDKAEGQAPDTGTDLLPEKKKPKAGGPEPASPPVPKKAAPPKPVPTKKAARPKLKKGDKPVATEEELEAAAAEFARLTNFFNYCTTESFVQFRRKLRRDEEQTGNAYFEVLRSNKGEIAGFVHIPAHQMRIGKMDDEPFMVDRKITELQTDGTVKVATVKEWRRFRRFAQSRVIYGRSMFAQTSDKVRWFKEFGDPRNLDKFTGEFETPGKPVPPKRRASELYHLKIYSARTPYGIPRYIGNLLSIFGDRAAEEINYITFRNNNIPSMAICVSNGQLTEGTIARIKDFVQSQIQGSDNYSKFLIIEGETPDVEDGEDGGQVKIDIKPLTDTQHKDALFQNYSGQNQDKIRRAFRLPPIFVGRADDYSRATAEASRRLADEQIFSVERDEFDAMMNRIFFPEMGIIYHKFKSNSPNTTDNSELVKILAGAEKTGGITPRIARYILQNVLGSDLPEFPKDFPADVPFSLTMAEAVKNEADPTEPGQQVTALKVLKELGFNADVDADPEDEGDMLAIVKKMIHVAVNTAAETVWRKSVVQLSE